MYVGEYPRYVGDSLAVHVYASFSYARCVLAEDLTDGDRD